MPGRKAFVATAGAAAVLTLAGFGVGLALDDPEQAVGTVNLTDARAQLQPSNAGSRQIPALDELAGMVEGNVGDVDDLAIGRVDLDFGPERWMAEAGPLEDYDTDGSAEVLRDELAGLVGSEVRLRVRLDEDGDDAAVYAINELTYRAVSGPAPWQSAGAVGEDAVRTAAAAAVGDGARVADLEAEEGTTVAWEAEVVDSQGREHDVLLDSAGNVIDVRPD